MYKESIVNYRKFCDICEEKSDFNSNMWIIVIFLVLYLNIILNLRVFFFVWDVVRGRIFYYWKFKILKGF